MNRLYESESVLLKHRAIDECIVVQHQPGGQRLGYVVPAHIISSRQLLDELRQQVAPDHLPDSLVLLTRFPLTEEGRIDYVALADLPVLSEQKILALEQQLRERAGVSQVAVLPRPATVDLPRLHIDDLIPRPDKRLPQRTPAESQAELSSVAPADLPPSIVHGPALVGEESAAENLCQALLRAAEQSSHPIMFVDDQGQESAWTYRQLRDNALRILGGLQQAQLAAGDVVIFQLNNNPDILTAFWGCVLGGIVPVIMPACPTFRSESRPLDQLRHVWQHLDRPLILVDDTVQSHWTGLAASDPLAQASTANFQRLYAAEIAGSAHNPDPDDLLFFSLTSGSTGKPKCIQLTHRNILARAMGTNLLGRHEQRDVILNWLPFDHIGSISDWHLRCVVLGCKLVYAPKDYILKRPPRWLELIDQHRVTHTWAPNFAYSLINDHLKREPCEDLELSCVECFLTAGESISASVVDQFVALLAANGLRPSAIRPAFGMAELGSGVTYHLSAPGNGQTLFHAIRNTNQQPLARVKQTQHADVTFVCLGPPIPGVSLRIVDADNQVVRAQTIGRLQIRGAPVSPGYYKEGEANAVFQADGWFDTGDLGFLCDGQLYISGRAKESIIVNGENYYCREIEDVVESVAGVTPSFTAACSVSNGQQNREALAVFFSPTDPSGEHWKSLIRQIQGQLVKQVGVRPDYLLPLPPDQVPKTAIGKIQRLQLAHQFETGQFAELQKELDRILSNENTVPNWYFEKTWQRKEYVNPLEPASSMLLVRDDSPLAAELERALGRCCSQLSVAHRAASYRRLDEGRFQLNVERIEDWRQLIEEVEDCAPLDAITIAIDGESAANGSAHALDPLNAVSSLIEAVGHNDRQRPLVLNLLSDTLQHVDQHDSVCAERALLLGFSRSVSHERVALKIRHIDVNGEAAAERVARECVRPCVETEVAFRGDHRWVPRLMRAHWPAPVCRAAGERADDLVLLCGHDPQALYWLADALGEHSSNLLLLAGPQDDGSSPNAAADARQWECLTCDWSRPQEIARLVSRRLQATGAQFGGVVFLARRLPLVDADHQAALANGRFSMERNRLQCAGQVAQQFQSPRLLILSSVNGYFGGAGELANAAINSFYEAFAHQFTAVTRLPCSCLWGEFEPTSKELEEGLLQLRGYQRLSKQQTVASLLAALHGPVRQLIAGLNTSNFFIQKAADLERYEAEQLTALCSAQDEQTFAATVGDQLNGLDLRFVDKLPTRENGEVDRDRALLLLKRGSQNTGLVAASEIERRVASIWQEILQLESIGLHDNIFELGGHSLLLIQIHARLEKEFQRSLSVVEMFQHPTIATLAKLLGGDQLPDRASPALVGQSRAEMRKRTRAATESTDVAVIGMAGRFPGAATLQQFWANLRDGVESITFFDANQAIHSGVDPQLVSHADYVRAAPVLEHVEDFDADFFGFSAREAELMDPQHRVFLECAWEAMEDSGYPPGEIAQSVGVFAGAVLNTYLLNNVFPAGKFRNGDRSAVMTLNSLRGFEVMVGNDKDYLPTRVSYKLNLTGPSVNVQTACSTTLVAVHMAAQSVINGECDMALAGGVSISVPQQTGYLYEDGLLVSPDGHCRAFDAQAAGTIFGNGCGVVLLKPLSRALQDGDTIYGVIKGSAVNNDGLSKVGYHAPSPDGQAAVVGQALAMADVPADSISFIEAHGTGTALGDPIEVAGLAQAFHPHTEKAQFCALGSVKTNIGHLQIASGIAGFIKAMLALHHKQIPPSLHYVKPNPQIEFETSPFYVNAALQPWETNGQPRRAGINSLGIGGTNAHVIIEQAPESAAAQSGTERPRHILTFSAKTQAALSELGARYLHLVENLQSDARLADLCYSANTGRNHFEYRAAIHFQQRDQLVDQLREMQRCGPIEPWSAKVPQTKPKVAFLFAGQGSQYAEMGRGLFEHHVEFRRVMQQCDSLLQPHLGGSLLELLYQPDGGDLLNQTQWAQPALFSLQYALARLWIGWGIRPAAVFGHSVGELVAAVLADVMTLEDALLLVAHRGRLMQRTSEDGRMLAVAMDGEQVRAWLPGAELSIAALNSPHQTVLSGSRSAIEAAQRHFEARGIRASLLNTTRAFHSRLMDPILEEFHRIASSVPYRAPSIPLASYLTGEFAGDEIADADYWTQQIRHTVDFAGAMQTLDHAVDGYLEIGPQPTLIVLGQQCLSRPDAFWLATLDRRSDDWHTVLSTLARLELRGADIDWKRFDHGYARLRMRLPLYPFQRNRYWIDRPQTRSPAVGGEHRDEINWLLGRRLRSPGFKQRIFQSAFDLPSVPLLKSHRFLDTVVTPGAFYLAMAVDAACLQNRRETVQLDRIAFVEALTIQPQDRCIVQLLIDHEREGAVEEAFQIVSAPDRDERSADQWTTHAHGTISHQVPDPATGTPPAIASMIQQATGTVSQEQFYQNMRDHQVQLDSPFQVVRSLWKTGEDQWVAQIGVDPGDASSGFLVHPLLLDGALQIPGGALDYDRDATMMPTGVGRLRVFCRPSSSALFCRFEITQRTATTLYANIELVEENGTAVAQFSDVRYECFPSIALGRALGAPESARTYQVEWQEWETGSQEENKQPTGRWLVIGPASELCRRLVQRLAGAEAVTQLAPEEIYSPLGGPSSAVRPIAALQSGHAESNLAYDRVLFVAGPYDSPNPPGSAGAQQHSILHPSATLLTLIRSITAHRGARAIALLTTGAHALPGDHPDQLDPAGAAAVGLARSARLEHPQLEFRSIDTVWDNSVMDRQIDQVLSRLTAPLEEVELALRGQRWFAPRLRERPQRPSSRIQFREDATYLITGGTGGLGQLVAGWLIERGARHLALVSRQAPPAETKTSIQRWQSTGVDVCTYAADTSDEARLAQIFAEIRQQQPPLKGVFHLAGELADATIDNLTVTGLETVAAAKTTGAWLLGRLADEESVEHFVCFSSIAGLLGSPGQANYAAANAAMDLCMLQRQLRGKPGCSIQWGPWSSVGMAARLQQTQRDELHRRGVFSLPAAANLSALDDLLSGAAPPALVARMDWASYRRWLPQSVFGKLFADLLQASENDPNGPDALMQQLREAEPDVQLAILESLVVREAGSLLGLGSGSSLAPDQGFFEAGMDSLASIQLRNRLQAAIGKPLPATLAFKYSNVQSLSRHLAIDILQLKSSSQPGAPEAPPSLDLDGLSEAELAARLAEQLALGRREND